MRTKHLLWAFALPAVFAACTNDDFESVVQGNDALQGRPMAGDVKLNFDFGEADTRLTSDFKFEVGDEIGATLMDEYKKDGVDYNIWGLPNGKNVYDFVNYIQTNYRYTNTESGWTNSNLLCSGNYFFYYPYTAQLNTRVAFEKYLNPNQVLKEESSAGARQVVIDNQMFVGYKLVEGATEGSTQVLNVSMQPVFAAPLFTIMCTDSEPVTIQKIALQYIKKDKDMPLMAIVDPTDEERRSTTTVAGVPYVDFEKDPTSAVRMAKPETEKPQLDKDAVIGARQIQVTMPEGTTTSNGDPVNVYMVIPAGDYTATGDEGPVELLIYTNKGLVTADLSVAHENMGSTGAQNNVTNDVAMGVVSGTMEKTRHINITFDEVAISNPDEFAATSTEDLDTYVAWSAQIGGVKNMWIKSTGKETELSAATVATLAKNKNITMNVLGDITIAENVKSEDFDAAKINFVGGNVRTKLAYDDNNKVIGVDVTNDGNLADEKGQTIYNKATLNNIGAWLNPTYEKTDKTVIEGDITFQNEGNVTLTGLAYSIKFINKGTMTINAGVNATTKLIMENKKQDYLENYGTLNINSSVEADNTVAQGLEDGNGWINNYAGATLTIGQNAAVVARIDNKMDSSKGCEYGEIVVNGSWTIFGNSGKNQGVIEVNGSMNVPAKGAKYENTKAWSYPIAVWPYTADFTPNIKNNGSVKNVTNNGNVELMTKDVSYSSVSVSGEVAGMVNNTVGNSAITVNPTETIYCEISKPMTFTEVNEFVEDTQSKLVRFVAGANTLTIDAKTDDEDRVIEEKVGKIIVDEIEINSNLTIATANRDAKARIYGVATHKAMTITVAQGVTATLGDGVKLEVGRSATSANAEITANGTLQVNGSAQLGGYIASSLVLKGTIKNFGRIYNAAQKYSETDTEGWTGNNATTEN